MLRRVVPAAVSVMAAAALYALCYQPYRCARLDHELTGPTEWVNDNPHHYASRARAEQNLRRLESALEHCHGDTRVRLLMLAGANARALSRHERAAALFREALARSRRPELLASLAGAELGAGDRASATRAAVLATEAGGLRVADWFADGLLKEEIYDRFGRRRDILRERAGLPPENLVSNGNFAATASGATASSAAAPWQESGTAVESTAAASTRRRGESALHVRAATAGTGIYQILPAFDPPVQKVMITAWVYVVSGRVTLGAGSDGAAPVAQSSGVGRWERLRGTAEACPRVNYVALYSIDETAEFYVDDVRARNVITAPCR